VTSNDESAAAWPNMLERPIFGMHFAVFKHHNAFIEVHYVLQLLLINAEDTGGKRPTSLDKEVTSKTGGVGSGGREDSRAGDDPV